MPGFMPGIHAFNEVRDVDGTGVCGGLPRKKAPLDKHGHDDYRKFIDTMVRMGLKRRRLPNPHPGEILWEDFMKPLGISQNALARAIQVPPRRVNELVHGKRAVTADTDLRLARYFGVSEGFFMGLQVDYDLMERRREIGSQIAAIRPRAA